MRRDLGAGDFRPAGDQFARGKALLGISIRKHPAQQDGQWLGGDRTGLGHDRRLCVHKTMTLSGAATGRKTLEAPDRADPADRPALLLDWYDRHRRRLPWRPLPGFSADPY